MKLIIQLPTLINNLKEVELRAATEFQLMLRNKNITEFCFLEPSKNRQVIPYIMFEKEIVWQRQNLEYLFVRFPIHSLLRTIENNDDDNLSTFHDQWYTFTSRFFCSKTDQEDINDCIITPMLDVICERNITETISQFYKKELMIDDDKDGDGKPRVKEERSHVVWMQLDLHDSVNTSVNVEQQIIQYFIAGVTSEEKDGEFIRSLKKHLPTDCQNTMTKKDKKQTITEKEATKLVLEQAKIMKEYHQEYKYEVGALPFFIVLYKRAQFGGKDHTKVNLSHPVTIGDKTYHVRSFIEHQGVSNHRGHYITLVRGTENTDWKVFNDSNLVEPLKMNEDDLRLTSNTEVVCILYSCDSFQQPYPRTKGFKNPHNMCYRHASLHLLWSEPTIRKCMKDMGKKLEKMYKYIGYL